MSAPSAGVLVSACVCEVGTSCSSFLLSRLSFCFCFFLELAWFPTRLRTQVPARGWWFHRRCRGWWPRWWARSWSSDATGLWLGLWPFSVQSFVPTSSPVHSDSGLSHRIATSPDYACSPFWSVPLRRLHHRLRRLTSPFENYLIREQYWGSN